MSDRLTLVTEPEELPLTLDEVKNTLRIEFDDDDLIIDRLIKSATEQAEYLTQRALVTQTWELQLDSFPGCGWIEIPKPPLQGVESVKYLDQSGALQTLDESLYTVYTESGPRAYKGRVVLNNLGVWPLTRRQVGSVIIRFICGYGNENESAERVPERIKDGMLAYIGERYENREETGEGRNFAVLPNTMMTILSPFVVDKLGI